VLDVDDGSLRTHLERIDNEDARDAYPYLIRHAATLARFRYRASNHGEIPDFRYYDGNEQPYAFIPNIDLGLLFHFRRAAIRTGRWTLDGLRQLFSEANETSRDEQTVGVDRLADAKKLTRPVFPN